MFTSVELRPGMRVQVGTRRKNLWFVEFVGSQQVMLKKTFLGLTYRKLIVSHQFASNNLTVDSW